MKCLFASFVTLVPFFLFYSGASPPTLTGRPLTTRPMRLSRPLRLTTTNHLVKTSASPYNSNVKRDRFPSSLLYQPCNWGRRSQALFKNPVISSRPFASSCCLSSEIFAQQMGWDEKKLIDGEERGKREIFFANLCGRVSRTREEEKKNETCYYDRLRQSCADIKCHNMWCSEPHKS